MLASAPTPSDITYETPSEMALTPSQYGLPTPRPIDEPAEIPTAADEPVNGYFAPLALGNMMAATQGLDIGSSLGGLAQQDLNDSGSDGSSLMEIDRADMYSSSSSDSSVTVIKEKEFDAAVRGFELAVLTQPTSGREEANCRLRAAARSGNVWLVQHLLNSGADVESFSESGTTALHAAAFYGHVAVADLLIKAGADVEASKTGDEVQVSYTVADMRKVHCVRRPRPIHLATSRSHIDIVSLLLDNNARVDSYDGNGGTALVLAIRLNLASVVRILIDRGANLEWKTIYGDTPLMCAARNDDLYDIAELLIEFGANIETRNVVENTPLLGAIRFLDTPVPIVQLLLSKGVNIEPINGFGRTPLIQATYENHVEVVRLLIEQGANTSARDTNGDTSLIIAAKQNSGAIVQLLIEGRASLELTNISGGTALSEGVRQGAESTVRLLIGAGADVDGKTWAGEDCPLGIAVEKRSEVLVRLLLDNGAKADALDKHGLTPLMRAAWGGSETILQLLKRHLNNPASMAETV